MAENKDIKENINKTDVNAEVIREKEHQEATGVNKNAGGANGPKVITATETVDNKVQNNDPENKNLKGFDDMNLEELEVEEAFKARDNKWAVSLAPHLRTNNTTQKVMLSVIIALAPQLIYSIYAFGFNAAFLIGLSVLSCVFFEAATQKAFKKPILIGDLSAVVTGILLAFNIPATAPWWLPIVGGFFAIVIAKEFFGGIGQNFVNPALAGRAALMISWPTIMTNYSNPDGITGPTPLQIMKGSEDALPSIKDMLIGNIGGVLGETATVLLLIGFLYLAIKKIADWKITVIYILSTMCMLFIQGIRGEFLLYHLLGGGLILGACFMATDFATAPISNLGRAIFAIGCGVLTALIRVRGGMAEGVSYSILIMNTFVPLIDRLTRPRIFGEAKK